MKNKVFLIISFFLLSLALGTPVFSSGIEHSNDSHGMGKESHAAAPAESHSAAHGSTASANSHGEPGVAPVAKYIRPDTAKHGGKTSLPIWPLVVPVLAAIGIACFRKNTKEHFLARNILTVGACLIDLGILIAMWFPVVKGCDVGGTLYKGLFFDVQGYLPFFSLTFRVDALALCIATVCTILWLGSFINSVSYMTHEHNPWRYDLLAIITLTAQIGVFFAGDFFTLFLFFEGLIIFPYGMVAHKEDAPSLFGANTYLYMGVFTGLFLLAGSMIQYAGIGTVDIAAMGSLVNQSMTSTMKFVMFGCYLIGFGGKAGLFLEHAWLPQAHPVAPAPGSTLLSGAMIKAGAYGIIRVACQIFSPEKALTQLPWLTMANLGYVLIWIGVVSMFLAVLSALITANAKKMLAFHSVSQMGYIIMGVGCAAYMGRDGAMGFSGALYHMVNHALFKASLFICVGTVYFRTHELDMYKLGGMITKMPITCLGLFIAACGISGIPMFNGFASKTLLHHAILEAYEHSAHAGVTGIPDFKLRIAEVIFMVTAGGTFASNMKLFALTAFGKRPEKYDHVKEAPWPMLVSIGLFSFCILFIGIYPNWLIENFIGPALAYFKYDPGSHAYHILYNIHAPLGAIKSTIPILWNPVHFEVFANSEVLHNLIGGGTAVMMGGMYFILGMRFHLFHAVVPERFTLVHWYEKGIRAFRDFCNGPCRYLDDSIYKFTEFVAVTFWMPMLDPKSIYGKVDNLVTDMWGGDIVVDGILSSQYVKVCDATAEADVVGVDGGVNGVAWGIRTYSQILRRAQTGFAQTYALVMVGGLVGLTALMLFLFN